MPSLNFNQITKAYRGTQQLDKIYHGNKKVFPVQIDYSNGDPHWNNVILLLRGDGTNGNTNIIDNSPNPKTISRFGDAVISTAQSKYGGSSIFQGTNGYLSANLGTYGQGDFTVESWIYCTSFPEYSFLLGTLSAGNWHIGVAGSTTINVYIGSHLNFSASLPLNTWFHLAVSRQSGVVRAFLNGVLLGSQSLSTAMAGATPQILKRPNDNYYLKGYSDSLRFTEGIARYTANFNTESDTYLAY